MPAQTRICPVAAMASLTFIRWWREMVEWVNLRRHRIATLCRNAHPPHHSDSNNSYDQMDTEKLLLYKYLVYFIQSDVYHLNKIYGFDLWRNRGSSESLENGPKRIEITTPCMCLSRSNMFVVPPSIQPTSHLPLSGDCHIIIYAFIFFIHL